MEEVQTEQKILEAARKVFQRSGIGGARMQEIADEAGINKASLHYYYRSKEKLFQTVFQEDFQRYMVPNLKIMRDPSLALKDRIKNFITSYTGTLIENPHLPLFILHELSRNPDRLMSLVRDKMFMQAETGDFSKNEIQSEFVRQIREGIDSGIYNDVEPEQFLISLIGMCVFPFVARPMIKLLFNKDDKQYLEFLNKRQFEIMDYAFRILIRDYKPYDEIESLKKRNQV